MDSDRRSRILFVSVNLAVTLLVLTVSGTLATLALTMLDWGEAWLFVGFGALAGAAIGSIRDSRTIQAVLGMTGVTLLGFALFWSERGSAGLAGSVVPLLGSGALSFATILASTRVWGRRRRVPEPTTADIDAALSRPGMGVTGHE